MSSLAGLGEAVGEYSGHGQGEEDPTQLAPDSDEDPMETCDTSSETTDTKPVHIFFDIETTAITSPR